MNQPNPDNLLPSIFDHLERSNLDPIGINNLECLLETLQAKTNLSKETLETLTKMFFQEMRNGMLRGDVLDLRGLGRLLITNPHNSSSQNISPRLRNNKKIKNKLNKES